ncbi:MAG: lysostaphin resistance A-like protein [Vicinamibacterales bacterium]
MPFTLAIVATILSYVWIFERTAAGAARAVPVVLVIALTLAHAVRTGEWGFRRDAFLPALWKVAIPTVVGVAVILAAGELIETLHPRRAVGRKLLYLTPWGGGQQFVLQTLVFREARELMPRGAAIVTAAAIFGAVHLPNPFLTPVTFAAGLVWCWVYSRHPNIIPLAISHALGTEAVLHAFDNDLTGHLRIGAAYLELAQDN